MSIAATFGPAPWKPARFLRSIFGFAPAALSDQTVDEDESRRRREFIQEMMDTHPEALQSELGCRTLMSLYSEGF